MEAKLVVVGGKVSKSIVPLALPTTIGRGRDAKLTIAHPMVSRKHCEVFEKDGLLMIRDLGSLNGTLIADQRVKEAPLPPNAEFTVGPLTFRVDYQFDGDLKSLPDPVFEQSTSPTGAMPDFQAIDSLPSDPPPSASPTELSDEDLALLDAAARPTAPSPKKKPASNADEKNTKNTMKAGTKKATPSAKMDDDGLLLELDDSDDA
jgi:predicted component of type VI protein secretion system